MGSDNWTDKQKALWEFIIHAENVLVNRTNFFLVAQSMLFITLVSSKNVDDKIITNVILCSGVGLSLAWLILGLKLYIRVGDIVSKVVEFFPEYRDLLTKTNIPVSSNLFIAIYIPVFFIIVWLVLGFYYF